MWRLKSPFSAWVVPLRLLSVAVFILAFVRMLAAPDLTLLLVVILGSLLWFAGTVVEERTPLYRRLKSTALKNIMRTNAVRVPSWTPVSRFRSEHRTFGSHTYVVSTQDGYDGGIIPPEKLNELPDSSTSSTRMGQLASPILYVHGLHTEDRVLEAFLRFRHGKFAFSPILDKRGELVGIVTPQDVESWLKDTGRKSSHTPAIPVAKRRDAQQEKLAA